jgi:phosphoribosylanthranilate isomerase
MTVLVKICGVRTREALEAALKSGADLVGFVFFPPSPRNLGFNTARALGQGMKRDGAGKVALTVDADDQLIEAVVGALDPDVLQLHGTEPPERVLAVKRRFGRPVMKAIHVATLADLAVVASYAAVADRLLFDARPPPGATRPGGLGRAFDWRLLEQVNPGLPFLLSGGLDAENVAVALRATRAHGVDVSSGVERAPGEKDVAKIGAFVRAVRRAGVGLTPMDAARLA